MSTEHPLPSAVSHHAERQPAASKQRAAVSPRSCSYVAGLGAQVLWGKMGAKHLQGTNT